MTRLTDSVGVVLCLVVRVGIHAVNGQVHGLRHLSALPGKLLSRMWQHVSRCATFPAAELASQLLLPTRRGVASATGGTLCRFALLSVVCVVVWSDISESVVLRIILFCASSVQRNDLGLLLRRCCPRTMQLAMHSALAAGSSSSRHAYCRARRRPPIPPWMR